MNKWNRGVYIHQLHGDSQQYSRAEYSKDYCKRYGSYTTTTRREDKTTQTAGKDLHLSRLLQMNTTNKKTNLQQQCHLHSTMLYYTLLESADGTGRTLQLERGQTGQHTNYWIITFLPSCTAQCKNKTSRLKYMLHSTVSKLQAVQRTACSINILNPVQFGHIVWSNFR